MTVTAVDFERLSAGAMVEVETRSRRYEIECLGRDLIRISGHPDFCPVPAFALLRRALNDNGTMTAGCIAQGMRFAHFVDHLGPITTSRVVSVQVHN